MTLQDAIILLEDYNRWRRGAEIPQPHPTDIGVAISVVLKAVKTIPVNTNKEA